MAASLSSSKFWPYSIPSLATGSFLSTSPLRIRWDLVGQKKSEVKSSQSLYLSSRFIFAPNLARQNADILDGTVRQYCCFSDRTFTDYTDSPTISFAAGLALFLLLIFLRSCLAGKQLIFFFLRRKFVNFNFFSLSQQSPLSLPSINICTNEQRFHQRANSRQCRKLALTSSCRPGRGRRP